MYSKYDRCMYFEGWIDIKEKKEIVCGKKDSCHETFSMTSE